MFHRSRLTKMSSRMYLLLCIDNWTHNTKLDTLPRPSRNLFSEMKTNVNTKPPRRLLIEALAHTIWDDIIFSLLLIFEMVLSSIIIWKVPYTEIDWEAYMLEVSTAWDLGERNYVNIKGTTGPLVYPAGFLYLYGFLRWLVTKLSQEGDIHPSTIFAAQVIFGFLYLIQILIVLRIYISASRSMYENKISSKTDDVSSLYFLWSWRIAMVLSCLSKRIHSIYMLRLFNDGAAMLLLYFSIYLFAVKYKWNIGCVFFSLAVSIKMNILLFAPGLLLLLLQTSPKLIHTIGYLFICAVVQLVLGAPFLLTFPVSYLRKAFELDRVFTYEWTVNLKFLPESLFVSKPLSILLLVGHIGTLFLFAFKWYHHSKLDIKRIEGMKRLSPEYIIYTLFVSNYIGIVFARTLHYQFYSWYFHSLPFLLWMINIPLLLKIAIFGITEYSFNIFPASFTSSISLQLAHWTLLLTLYLSKIPRIFADHKNS